MRLIVRTALVGLVIIGSIYGAAGSEPVKLDSTCDVLLDFLSLDGVAPLSMLCQILDSSDPVQRVPMEQRAPSNSGVSERQNSGFRPRFIEPVAVESGESTTTREGTTTPRPILN